MGQQHVEERCEHCRAQASFHQLATWHRHAIAAAAPSASEQYLCPECFETLKDDDRRGWFAVADLMVD